jgi:hypothetical protein
MKTKTKKVIRKKSRTTPRTPIDVFYAKKGSEQLLLYIALAVLVITGLLLFV